MLVTSLGNNTSLGEMMMSTTTNDCDEEAKRGEDIKTFVTSKDVLEAIHDGVVSTLPQVHISDQNLASPIEDQLLHWPELKLGTKDMEVERRRRKVQAAKSFFFEKRLSAFLLKKDNDAEETIHLHWKGTAETILAMCSTYYDNGGIVNPMDDEKRAAFTLRIESLDTKGLLGLKYPHCSDEKIKAVADFLKAGVSIKLVSSQRLSVLKTIPMESGILPVTDLEAANSMIEDKLLFVQCLKREGEIVAVTGTTLSDSPSLKAADVGILMAQRISTPKWRKRIQPSNKLDHNNITGDSPFPSLQLLLVNLILSSLAAFAMLTIPPKTVELLEMKPIKHSDEPLILKPMWRNILVHVCYQAVVLLTFQFIKIGLSDSVKSAIIFNGFVLYNILNQFNARDIEKKNVFKG
ncbi:hypothetical protein C5167_009546 [Papaver somniferum]|uniref:Cation-transporting P-type ATPase C-terminal domain-containing protein n=1 Tax=Papaver somniferum TaxID=3469 RepID=A0A4Y7JXP9_PAPSO|nr:hypothetical protein C5167_009546 [Papaver somniferum]